MAGFSLCGLLFTLYLIRSTLSFVYLFYLFYFLYIYLLFLFLHPCVLGKALVTAHKWPSLLFCLCVFMWFKVPVQIHRFNGISCLIWLSALLQFRICSSRCTLPLQNWLCGKGDQNFPLRGGLASRLDKNTLCLKLGASHLKQYLTQTQSVSLFALVPQSLYWSKIRIS